MIPPQKSVVDVVVEPVPATDETSTPATHARRAKPLTDPTVSTLHARVLIASLTLTERRCNLDPPSSSHTGDMTHPKPPHPAWTTTRRVINFINLATPLGWIVARAGRATVAPAPHGMWVARRYQGPLARHAGAVCIGNIVVTRSDVVDPQPDDGWLLHESAHVSQWALLSPIGFIPAYLLASGWSLLRTGDAWSNNIFERLASLEAGGYTQNPTQPITTTMSNWVGQRIRR